MNELKNNYEYLPEQRACSHAGVGQKLMFFIIGSGIGATLALLFAPKSGSELRSDIADMAGKRYDETLAAANQLKKRTTEYYGVARETSSEVFDVVSEGISAVKEEVSTDVRNIGSIVENTAKRAVNSAKHAAIR